MVVSPASVAMSVPVMRVRTSPAYGPYSLNKWLVMPRPLVALITSISRPMRPRVVMLASIVAEGGRFSTPTFLRGKLDAKDVMGSLNQNA